MLFFLPVDLFVFHSICLPAALSAALHNVDFYGPNRLLWWISQGFYLPMIDSIQQREKKLFVSLSLLLFFFFFVFLLFFSKLWPFNSVGCNLYCSHRAYCIPLCAAFSTFYPGTFLEAWVLDYCLTSSQLPTPLVMLIILSSTEISQWLM